MLELKSARKWPLKWRIGHPWSSIWVRPSVDKMNNFIQCRLGMGNMSSQMAGKANSSLEVAPAMWAGMLSVACSGFAFSPFFFAVSMCSCSESVAPLVTVRCYAECFRAVSSPGLVLHKRSSGSHNVILMIWIKLKTLFDNGCKVMFNVLTWILQIIKVNVRSRWAARTNYMR